MASREGGSTGNVLLALAIGALAGAAIALLYAPASGEDTRRKIRQKARDGRDRVTGAVDDGREFFERQKDNVTAAVEHGREVFEQVKRERGTLEKS